MLYDLSQYLPFESFVILWLFATFCLVAFLSWRDEKRSRDND